MSLLSNGNESLRHSYVHALADASQVGEARRFAHMLCNDFRFDETQKGKVGIVVNELGNNLVRYARDGRLIFRKVGAPDQPGLEILSVDRGPGLDEAIVMQDGFSTGTTPGTGLGAVKRLSHEFDLFSQRDKGTVLMSRIFAAVPDPGRAAEYDIGAVSVPVSGEIVSGDGWVVHHDREATSVMVVDGLGHGPAANKAALEAIAAFEEALPGPPDQILQTIHGRLKGTRGGAVFLVRINPDSIAYAGVGNIRTIVQTPGAMKTLISHNGTAGLQIRTVQPAEYAWNGTGYVILHSDGLTTSWDINKIPGIHGKHPAVIAGLLYRDHERGRDDTTVVVLRRRP